MDTDRPIISFFCLPLSLKAVKFFRAFRPSTHHENDEWFSGNGRGKEQFYLPPAASRFTIFCANQLTITTPVVQNFFMEARQTTLSLEHPYGQTSAILTEPAEDTTSAVILCHGFLSNKDSRTNIRLTELLTPKGFSTLRFDWFGMGDSSGRFADITVTACLAQLESLLQDMNNRGYRDIGLIGGSFGGLLAILVAADHPELFALGLKCPVPNFPEMLELEFGQDGITEWKRTNTIPNVTGGQDPIALNFEFYHDCHQFNAYAQAKKITSPCLIVHGEKDELVPLHQIQRLTENLAGDKKLHFLPEANHHFGRPEDFRTMSLTLTDWMVAHVPTTPLASRATP